MPKHIFIARHGQTDAQVFRYIQTQKIDMLLTKFGRHQAQKLGERLVEENIRVIIHSPTKRARETALIVSNILTEKPKFSSLIVKYDESLLEIDSGDLEGMFFNEMKEKYLTIFRDWYSHCPIKLKSAQFPGGESFEQAVVRANNFIGRLPTKNAYNGDLLIVGHGGMNSIIAALLLGIKPEEFFGAVHFGNCGLLKIKFNETLSGLPQLDII